MTPFLLLLYSSTLKYYTIRKGKKSGIFTSWKEIKSLIIGFPDAKYKSFPTQQQAEEALQQGREPYYEAQPKKNLWNTHNPVVDLPFIKESIAVDAACSGNPGIVEYRGIDLQTDKEIFHQQFEIGTNNVGEFLAIVHGLTYCRKALIMRPNNKPSINHPNAIYTDSITAMSRVNHKKCNSKLRTTNPERTIRKAVYRAEQRLKKNGIPFTLLKWETDERGEIPADFGRK